MIYTKVSGAGIRQSSISMASMRKKKETHCLVCDAVVDDTRPYYRRYRTCHICATAERVILNGGPHRFCQQCGKYERLELFQGLARTCRVALARHSERRRNATIQRKKKKMEGQAFDGKGGEQDAHVAPNTTKYNRVATTRPIPLRLYPEDSEEATLARKMTARLMSRLDCRPGRTQPLPVSLEQIKYPFECIHKPLDARSVQNRMPDSQSLAVERGLRALLESMGGTRS